MPSFYTPHLATGMKNLTIEGEEYHHIVHVFRKKEAEKILLTNGKGLLVEALIDNIGKKILTVKTLSGEQRDKSLPVLTVGFSLLRSKNDHIIVEKLTELGVSQFFPFTSKYSVRAVGENTRDKFTKTAIAAIKQCDNPYLPEIKEVQTLEKTLSALQRDGYTILVALERDTNKLLSECLPEPFPEKIVLFFGPEGGFSDEEIALFTEKGVANFTIGNHILRAETAAIAGVSQLLLSILQKQPAYF